jgi:hypothetical protein
MFKHSFFSAFFGHLISNSALCGRFIRTSRLFMGFGARLRFGHAVAIKALSAKGFRPARVILRAAALERARA